MRYYSVREAKWITIGAQAKKPGTKGANGKKHGGVAVLIGDDGVILKGPAHMKGKKPDELGGRQKTLGEKPGEKQEPKKYQNLAFGPNGEIAEPDKPKSPPPGAGYSDLRAAAKVEPVAAPPAPTAAKPAKTKAAKSQKPPENYDDKQDKKHARNLARLEKSRKELADIGDAARTLLAKAPPEMHAKIQDMIDRADAEKNNLAAALKPTEFPDKGEPPPMVTGYTPGADYSDSYDDLRKAAAQPAPEPTPATAPAPAKPAKPVKVPKVAKPEPVAAPTLEPKPEKGETVRAKIARVKAEKEKRYNDTLKKRGKKEADKQKADDKRQAKAEKDALNPAQAEARKKKQVERISKINAARPESLISLVRKEGGISGGDYDYATDIKEFGLKSALNKRGLKLDDMAKALQNAGHIVVPEGKKAEDVLLAGLQTRASSALSNHTGRYDSEYDDFVNNREDADNAPGADSDRVASVISRGEEAGENQGDDDGLAQILGFEPSRSDADEPEPSDYGHPDDYEPEEGDLGDGGEITGADTSFDFGAPEPPPAPAPAAKEPETVTWNLPEGGKQDIQLRPSQSTPGSMVIYNGEHTQGRKIPNESVQHFKDDLAGTVNVPPGSGIPEVEALSNGSAKFLGRGDDGLAFRVGDKVIKADTVTPFIPTNPGHMTPAEAIDRLKSQTENHNKIANALKGAGVVGVEPQEWHEHGGRGFAVSSHLDTKTKLNAKQISQVRDTIDAIHDAGYVVGDSIQAGINKDGNPVIYDLGKARLSNEKDVMGGGTYPYDKTRDNDKFERFATENGHEDAPPLRNYLAAKIDQFKNLGGLMSKHPAIKKKNDEYAAKYQAQLDKIDSEKTAPGAGYDDLRTAAKAAPPPTPAPSPASPPVDMFGNATTTAKKQPDMMTDMFGARIQAEAPKAAAAPTVADDAAKSLDWLDKNDPKKDGSAEMFGSLFSPGASGASAKTQPEAPGEGYADLRAAATQIKEPQRGWTSERQDFHRTGIGGVNTHAGKTADGAAEFDELKNKLGADSGEIASVNLGELYKKHLDAAMQQGGVDKEAFDSAMGEGPTGKNYSRLTALNGEAARRTRAELKEKTGPYIAHNTDGAIAAGYHANPADMVPGATDTDYRRSSAAIITGPETQAKNYKAIYGKPAKAGPALAGPLFGNQPAPAPTPATAPEPGTGYDDLRAAAAKKPLPPTPPAGLADRIAKRGTPTTIGPAKPVDPTDYNDPKEKARIAAFISRDLSGAASPKAAAKKLVRDLPFLSPEKFRARLDAVKSEFPEIYQALKEDPGIAGPDAHAEIAAHTGGEPPREFPGAAPSRIPGEGFADLRAAAAEPEATPAVGKPAHEMTKAEFLAQAPTDKAKQYMDTSSMHRNKVQAALDGGQNVPSEVLADYPGIKKTEPQPQQGPTAREIKAKLQAETDARQAQGEQDEANVRARNNQDYQKSRQAAIDAGQDVEDGDEKQIRRYIRQNEKDKASALGTIARNGPDTDAQDFADSMDKENNRLKAKLPKVAKPEAPPTVKPSTPAPGEGFADLRAAAAKEPEVSTITPEPSAASPRDLGKSEQRTPDEHAKGELLGNRSIFGGLKRTKAEAKEVLAKRIQQILDSPGMSKVTTDFGLTPEQTYTTAKINGKWAVIPSHASDVATATYRGNPVSAEAVEKYGIILPKNYTKQGEMYVAEPSQPEEPEQPKPPEPKKKKPPTQKAKGLTDDPEKFQQGDRFKGENGEEFQVFASRQGALTAHPVVDGKPQINKSTEKKFAITDAAAAANPTHRRDFVPGFDQSQPGRDSEEIAQDRARLAKTPTQAPGTGYADLRAAAKEPEAPPAPQKPIDIPPKIPDTTSPGATTAPEPEKIKVEHFSVTASGRGFSQAIALLKKRGGKFNPATKTWAVPTGKVTADDASSFGLQQKAFPQAVRSKRDEDNFGNEDDPERFRVYR